MVAYENQNCVLESKGANEKNKRMVIKDFVRAQKADLVCLQETKLQEM